MATLHLIYGNLGTRPELAQQLQSALSVDDALVFIGQGIYSLAVQTVLYRQSVYVLTSDVALTGVVLANTLAQTIDYAEFVALGVRYERSLSWN